MKKRFFHWFWNSIWPRQKPGSLNGFWGIVENMNKSKYKGLEKAEMISFLQLGRKSKYWNPNSIQSHMNLFQFICKDQVIYMWNKGIWDEKLILFFQTCEVNFYRAQITISSVECYDPLTDMWRSCTDLPMSRSEAGAVVL